MVLELLTDSRPADGDGEYCEQNYLHVSLEFRVLPVVLGELRSPDSTLTFMHR